MGFCVHGSWKIPLLVGSLGEEPPGKGRGGGVVSICVKEGIRFPLAMIAPFFFLFTNEKVRGGLNGD